MPSSTPLLVHYCFKHSLKQALNNRGWVARASIDVSHSWRILINRYCQSSNVICAVCTSTRCFFLYGRNNNFFYIIFYFTCYKPWIQKHCKFVGTYLIPELRMESAEWNPPAPLRGTPSPLILNPFITLVSSINSYKLKKLYQKFILSDVFDFNR